MLSTKSSLLEEINCTPVRRQHSAPARLLDGCLLRVGSLTQQVDSLLDKVRGVPTRSQSVPDLTKVSARGAASVILEQVLAKVWDRIKFSMSVSKQCHHCHRLLSHPDHKGVGSGSNRCTLDHFELCPGGRKSEKGWTGCPDEGDDSDGQEGGPSSSTDTVTSGEASPNEEFNEINITKPKILPAEDKLVKLDPKSVEESLAIAASIADRVVLDTVEIEDTDDEEDMHLREEIERLQQQVELQKKAKDDMESLAKKEKKRLRREKLEKERADLMQQSKLLSRPSQPSSAANKSVTFLAKDAGKNLKVKAAELAAKQQAKDNKMNKKDVDGLTIAGIRALPGMTPEVEQWMTRFSSSIPSLAKTPTAPIATGASFQPPGVLASHPQMSSQTSDLERQGCDAFDTDYVFSTSRGKLVPVVHDSPGRRSTTVPQLSFNQNNAGGTASGLETGTRAGLDQDGEASEDEDCPVQPEKGYRLEWFRDTAGRKYFIQKLITECYTPELVKSYVCDETTGRLYVQQVPKQNCPPVAKKAEISVPRQHPSTPAYVDHRVGSSTPVPQVLQGVRSPAPSLPLPKGERHPGFFPGDSEKEGKSKMPDLVQWARNCPVNWTTKVTTDKINSVLWAWANMSELLATRTGQAPNLQPGELEARLEHCCNVLEITLQGSSQSDFCGDSWEVARLYDQKVQQKVDQKHFSWLQLSAMSHGASHPHELMAAHQELSRKPKKTRDSSGGGGGVKDRNDDQRKKSGRCRTWNKSEVRGKCTYEVENAPEKCMYSHECTYCKSKSLKPVDHQRFFCKKRLEEES